MSWYKIEKYLFENYCIEGCYDDELCRLMDKHDKEIRNNAIEEFAEKMKEVTYQWFATGTIAVGMIDEIAEQMKEVE